MSVPFARVWCVTASVFFFVAVGVGVAQQGFPERPGDWEFTLKSDAAPDPIVQRFCLTNETWAKGLTQDPSCKVQTYSATSKGIHYSVDCEMKVAQIKASTDLTFDGMEHMTASGTTTTTMGGKTTTSQVSGDYRWKGATCTNADVNIKKKGGG